MSTVAWLTQWKRMSFLDHVSPHKTGHNVYVDINSSGVRMDYHFFIQMGLHILTCRKIKLLQFTIKPKNSSFIVKLRKRAFKRTYFITYT